MNHSASGEISRFFIAYTFLREIERDKVMIGIAHVIFVEICAIYRICIYVCPYWTFPKIAIRAFVKDCQLDRVAAQQPSDVQSLGLERKLYSGILGKNVVENACEILFLLKVSYPRHI